MHFLYIPKKGLNFKERKLRKQDLIFKENKFKKNQQYTQISPK